VTIVHGSFEKMKNLIIISLILVGSLSVNAQKVKVAADPSIDFSKYKTYAWDQGMFSNPMVQDMIIKAVDNEMAARGLQKVTTDPDLIVATLVATESDLNTSNTTWEPTLNTIAKGIPASSTTFAVTKGTLVIEISDASTKNSVWRGTATKTLEHGPTGDKAHDARTVAKPINKAVEKMFKNFPVRSRN
jgi:hypothetical protein